MKNIGKRLLSLLLVVTLGISILGLGERTVEAAETNSTNLKFYASAGSGRHFYVTCPDFVGTKGETNIDIEYDAATSNWNSEFTGTVIFVMSDGQEQNIKLTDISLTATQKLYFNPDVQDGTNVDVATIKAVKIPAGTELTYTKSTNKKPLKITSEFLLKKIPNGWYEEGTQNKVEMGFFASGVKGSNWQPVLTGQLVSGPSVDNNKTLLQTYWTNDDWSGTLTAQVTYVDASGNKIAKDAILYVCDSLEGEGDVCKISFQNIPKTAKKIIIPAGTAFVPNEVLSSAPIFETANDMTLINLDDSTLYADGTQNKINLGFYESRINGDYWQPVLTGQLVSGPSVDNNKTLLQTYWTKADWSGSLTAQVTYVDASGNKIAKDAILYVYDSLEGEGDVCKISFQNIPKTAKKIIIPAGTAFVPNTVLSSAPIFETANDMTLINLDDSTLYADGTQNKVKLSLYRSGFSGNYWQPVLAGELVSGPSVDNNKTLLQTYWAKGDWNEKLTAQVTYVDEAGNNKTQNAIIYVSSKLDGDVAGISFQNVPKTAKKIIIPAGTIFVPNASLSEAPLMEVSSDFILINVNGSTLVEQGAYNEAQLSYKGQASATSLDAIYLDVDLNNSLSMDSEYANWTDFVGSATFKTKTGEPYKVELSDVATTETGLYINLTMQNVEGTRTWVGLPTDLDTITFEAGTVLTFKSYVQTNGQVLSKEPIVLDNTIVLKRHNKTWICLNMLDVKAQNKNQTDSAVTVRFIGSINNLDYDEVGFLFANSASTELGFDSNGQPLQGCAKRSMTTVFSHLNVEGVSKEASAIYDTYSKFMFAYELRNIPTDVVLYARAYVKIGDTIILGEIRTVDPWSVE